MRYWEKDLKRLTKSGVSVIDSNEVLLELEEKPSSPRSNWCTPPFYIYTAKDVKKIKTAIDEGCGIDAPGSLVAWMCKHSILHSMEMPGNRYDIGTIDSYENIKDNYLGVKKNK